MSSGKLLLFVILLSGCSTAMRVSEVLVEKLDRKLDKTLGLEEKTDDLGEPECAIFRRTETYHERCWGLLSCEKKKIHCYNSCTNERVVCPEY